MIEIKVKWILFLVGFLVGFAVGVLVMYNGPVGLP